MSKNIITNAIINAGATAVYVIGIATLLFRAERIFGPNSVKETILVPIAILLLLVISAAVTGLLVFGKSAMWYLDGKKKEAMSLFVCTIGFLVVVVIITLLGVFLLKSA